MKRDITSSDNNNTYHVLITSVEEVACSISFNPHKKPKFSFFLVKGNWKLTMVHSLCKITGLAREWAEFQSIYLIPSWGTEEHWSSSWWSWGLVKLKLRPSPISVSPLAGKPGVSWVGIVSFSFWFPSYLHLRCGFLQVWLQGSERTGEALITWSLLWTEEMSSIFLFFSL